MEVLFAHLEDDPPRLSEANASLPRELDDVAARAMAKNACERYSSGAALVDAIRDATTPRHRRIGRRGAVLLAAVIAAIVTAAVVPSILLTGGAADGDSGVGTIATIAGTGTSGHSGDGGPAIEAELSSPSGVHVDADGNIYVGEINWVRRIDPDGVITTVAGTGRRGFAGDGIPSTEAEVSWAIAGSDADGNLLIMNWQEPILRVDGDGIISTIAGNGYHSDPQEGSQARDGSICNQPSKPAVDVEGLIHFGCRGAIYRISSDGIITRVVGTGEHGFGDGGPATEARVSLSTARGLDFDSEGNLYFADGDNSRIRKVDTSGVITTIAGTGLRQHAGDGGPAVLAALAEPFDLAIDSDGNIFISFIGQIGFADGTPGVVRRIDTEGIISTVAGGGLEETSVDGGPATEAELYGGWQFIDVDADGNLYIGEPGGHRVRKVTFNN